MKPASNGKKHKTFPQKLRDAFFHKKNNISGGELEKLALELEREHLELERKTHELEERTKELSLFFHIFNLVVQENISKEEFLQLLTDKIPEAWQYPEITCARIQIDNNEFKTENFKKTPWKQSVGISINDENRGSIEVFYLEEKPEMDEGPFLKEERNLIDAVALNVKRYLERQQAVETLSYNEILLREMGSVAKIGGWEFDPVSGKGTWTEETARIHDMDPEKETNMELGISFYSDDSKRKITQAVQNAIENKKTYDLELELISAKGIRKWVRTIGKPIVENGKVVKVRGSFQDITEFKKQQQLLTEKEENLRITLNSIGDAVIATDTKGFITRMNPVAETLTGWLFQDTVNKKIEEIFHIVNAHTGEKAENPVYKVLLTGRIAGLANHTKLISKNGKEYQIADSGAPITDDKGDTTGVVLVFRDVTEEYKTQHELKESEERWHFALEGAGDGVWDWNLKTNKVFFSDQWKKMLGYEPHEIKNEVKEWENRVHPDDFDGAQNDIQRHIRGETEIYLNEHRLRCKDGSYKWILDRGKVLTFDVHGKPVRFVGTHTDNTKQKQTEETIRERERQLESMVSNLSGFVYRCNYDKFWTMIYLSQQFEKITEYPTADFIHNTGRTFNSIIKKEFQSEIFKKWEKAIEKKSVFEAEYPILTGSNQIKWLWERGTGVFDDNGNLLFLEGYIEDVSERKNAETLSRESEERFSIAFKASPAPLVISEIDTGLFIDVNDKWVELLGFSKEEQIGRTSKEVGIWRNPSERDRIIQLVLKNGSFKDEYIEFATKTGETILALWSAETIMLSGKKLMLSMIHDITARIKAENELRRLKENLEDEVKLKTRELRERVAELERFQQATIDREYRIKELRDNIKHLQNQSIISDHETNE